jgi:hypothetical protein
MPGVSVSPEESVGPDAAALAAELARAEAERDAAVTALDRRGRRARRWGRARRGLVGVLVVVFAVLLPLTVTLTWAHYTVLNSTGFENAVGPLVSKPAVTAAVATEVTDQLFTTLDAQGRVAQALPPKASFLAGPISTGVKGYVQTGVTKVLQSPQFQALWVQATSFAHAQLVAVLRGKSSTVKTTNGQVVLDLVPLLNASLKNIQGFASGVIGKPITLPPIPANEVPAAACEKIGAALGRPVPTTCGQIPLFPAAKLVQARRAVRAFDRSLVLLIVTPVVAAVALWLSSWRRRTLLQLSVGGLLGLVVARRGIAWLQNTLINTGRPEFKAARQAIMTQMLGPFFDVTRWLLIALLVVFAAALITGRYAWAQALRLRVAHYAREGANLVGAVFGHAHDDTTLAWARAHLDLLRVAGIAVAAIIVLAASVSFIGLLIIIILLAAYELGLHQLKPHPHPTPNPTPPTTNPTTPPPTAN